MIDQLNVTNLFNYVKFTIVIALLHLSIVRLANFSHAYLIFEPNEE